MVEPGMCEEKATQFGRSPPLLLCRLTASLMMAHQLPSGLEPSLNRVSSWMSDLGDQLFTWLQQHLEHLKSLANDPEVKVA